jgi:hypothetical protein
MVSALPLLRDNGERAHFQFISGRNGLNAGVPRLRPIGPPLGMTLRGAIVFDSDSWALLANAGIPRLRLE